MMLYVLPLNISSNMVMTPYHIVMTMGPITVAIILTLILSFVIPLLTTRYLFRCDLAPSTLQAPTIGSPTVPFIGTSMLIFLLGIVSMSLIMVSSITRNVFQLSLAMILISVAAGDKSRHISFDTQMTNVVKRPVVWSPVIALIIVLAGIHAPRTIPMSLDLLGKTSDRLALFTTKIVLHTHNIIITTATIITVIARSILVPGAYYLLLLKMGLSIEQVEEIVLTMAIPVDSTAMIIVMQHKTNEQEMASTMVPSIIAPVITMGGLIFLTSQLPRLRRVDMERVQPLSYYRLLNYYRISYRRWTWHILLLTQAPTIRRLLKPG